MQTADGVLAEIKEKVEKGKVVGKDEWIETAFLLNTLILDEQEKLFSLQRKVAEMKYSLLQAQEKKNVSAAELEIQTKDEFWEMARQDAKVENILEFIRIAKRQSDIL